LSNTTVLTGGTFLYQVLCFFSGILVIRALGQHWYGLWSFIYVFLSFFENFVRFGLDSILTKMVAQDRDQASVLLGNALFLRIVLLGLAIPAGWLIIHFCGYPREVQWGFLLASIQLLFSLRTVYETVFRVDLQMIYPVLGNIVKGILNLVLVAWAARYSPDLYSFIIVTIVSGIIPFLGVSLISMKKIPFWPRFDPAVFFKLFKECLPLIISGYLTLFYYRLDVILLSKLKSFEDVGYYGAATKLTESLNIIAVSLMTSMFPIFSRAFKENKRDFSNLVGKTWTVLLFIALPIAVGGTLSAPQIIDFFYGARYAPSALSLAILFWFTFFGHGGIFLVNLLVVCGKQKIDAYISFGLAFLSLILNFILIPSFSYNGSALATTIVEMTGLILMAAYLFRHPAIQLSFHIPRGWKIAGLNVLWAMGWWGLLQIRAIPFPVAAASGIFFYFFLAILLRVISLQTIKDILLYFRRMRSAS